MLSEAERAACAEAVADRVLRAITSALPPELAAVDAVTISVSACVGAAVGLAAAHNCTSAEAAVALVATIAESVAADIYGPAV